MIFGKILYSAGIRLYGLIIHLAALFQPKARQWVAGRKQWRKKANEHARVLATRKGPLVWFHCASLGEFEQGRPLIEWLKSEGSDFRILLTFFSPSGYEIRQNYEGADAVMYLPLDTPRNARDFLSIFRPDLVVFVKYEYWFHFLSNISSASIPLVLISSIFRSEQIFFRFYGGFFRKMLDTFSHIFVQDENSQTLLNKGGWTEVTVAGDTRIDRVLAIAGQDKSLPKIDQFAGESPVLVVGSSWAADEALLVPFMNEKLPADWKVIIAPHQIKETSISKLEQNLQLPTVRYSKMEAAGGTATKVMIIDNIGMLAFLYRWGRVAYIGGGFGTGIHNTLEPIAFGIPVVFGPRYQKFAEANFLVGSGGAFSVEDTAAFAQVFTDLLVEEAYLQAARSARAYVEQNQGATERIGRFLLDHYLQTKPAQ